MGAALRSSFLGNGGVSARPLASVAGPQRSVSAKGSQRLTVTMTSVFEKTNPYAAELKKTAAYISAPGKGILASDESNATTGKR